MNRSSCTNIVCLVRTLICLTNCGHFSDTKMCCNVFPRWKMFKNLHMRTDQSLESCLSRHPSLVFFNLEVFH